MFEPRSDWRPPNPAELPSWREAKRVAIDLETRDPSLTDLGPGVRRDGRAVGVSFAIEDGPSFYLPFGHSGGDNLPQETVVRYLQDQAREATSLDVVTGANLQYDLDYLLQMGIDFKPRRFRDVQVAEPLLDENQFSYSLDNIAKRHGLPGKDQSQLERAAAAFGLDAKKDLWRLPARHVGAYAEQDVKLPLILLRRQERRLEEDGLTELFDLECRLTPVLVRMRRRGVRVNFDRLDAVAKWTHEQLVGSLREASAVCGVMIDIDDVTKARVLDRAFSAVGVTLPRTPSGEPSTAKAVLAAIKHPLAGHIRNAQRVRKLQSFVASIRAHAVNGRVHTTFNQLKREDDDGDESGTIARLSSTDPNLQQQPTRDPEIGPMWRAIYEPDEGGQWACNDYSQQEPRWLIHFAELAKLDGATIAAECYRRDPTTDNHTMTAEMVYPTEFKREWLQLASSDELFKKAKKLRECSKIIYLGLCYGMGGAKLCRQLGLPTQWIDRPDGSKLEVAGPEGQAILDQFDHAVPFVKKLAYKARDYAERTGFVRTVLGRKSRFPMLQSGKRDWTSKALNRLIQGSAADQTKKAMVLADEAGFAIQLQVHDELDMTIGSIDEARRLATVMLSAVDCRVPHKVDIAVGPNWGSLEDVK